MRKFWAVFLTMLFGLVGYDYGHANESSLDQRRIDKISKKKRHEDDKRNAARNRAEAVSKIFGSNSSSGESDVEVLSRQIDSFGAYDKVLSSYLGVFKKKLPSTGRRVSEKTENLVRPFIKFMKALSEGKLKDNYKASESIVSELRESTYSLKEFICALDRHEDSKLVRIAPKIQRSAYLLTKFVEASNGCKNDELDGIISEFRKKERRLLHNDFVHVALTKAKELLSTKRDLLPSASRSLAERAMLRISDLITRRNRLIQERQVVDQFKEFVAGLISGRVGVNDWSMRKDLLEKEFLICLESFDAHEGNHIKDELEGVRKSLKVSEKSGGFEDQVRDIDSLIKTATLIIPIIDAAVNESFFDYPAMEKAVEVLQSEEEFLKGDKFANGVLERINIALSQYGDGSERFLSVKIKLNKLIDRIVGARGVFENL